LGSVRFFFFFRDAGYIGHHIDIGRYF